jgi:transcription initiation factor TFIIIB Brf1 subunit/transcription initiation factor TFIIB
VEEGLARPPQNVLDLGCGNGRNSLYIAKKYGAVTTLLDKDSSMIEWAQKQYALSELQMKSLCIPIESVATDTSKLMMENSSICDAEESTTTTSTTFDLVIFSYVVQHIDPVYYPLIFDFCKQVCNGIVLVDVFWNPSRVMEGEQLLFNNDQVRWYGLSYEELATLVAPRFNILSDRVARNEIAVVINMALTIGHTPLADILSKQYEYYSGRAIRRGGRVRVGRSSRVDRVRPAKLNIDSLSSVQILESLYPERFDFVKSELQQWIQSGARISIAALAAKFLWLCRINKIPVMLDEVSEDFDVPARVLLAKLSEISYVPPLSPLEYVDRIIRRLDLHEVQDIAKELANNDILVGCSPAVRACCAIVRGCQDSGVELKVNQLAAEAHVTPVAIRNGLKRKV